jgi:hypothetical protein
MPELRSTQALVTLVDIRIVYRVSEEDFIETRKVFAKNEKWVRRLSRRTMPWMGALTLSLVPVILIFGRDRVDAVPLALMGAYGVYCGFALPRYFRKLYRKDKRYQNEITVDISEDGVHVVTPTTDTRMKWNAINRFLESDKIFLLFHSEWSFSVVPKNAFGPGEVDSFRDLLRRKVLAVPS